MLCRLFFFSSRRRHTRLQGDWSSDVCSSDLVDAAVRALREGHTFYSENAGLPGLRREIADQYERLHGVTLDPGCEIVISASGVHALHLAVRSVIDPGDEAIIL